MNATAGWQLPRTSSSSPSRGIAVASNPSAPPLLTSLNEEFVSRYRTQAGVLIPAGSAVACTYVHQGACQNSGSTTPTRGTSCARSSTPPTVHIVHRVKSVERESSHRLLKEPDVAVRTVSASSTPTTVHQIIVTAPVTPSLPTRSISSASTPPTERRNALSTSTGSWQQPTLPPPWGSRPRDAPSDVGYVGSTTPHGTPPHPPPGAGESGAAIPSRQVLLGMTSSGRSAHDGAVPPCPCSLGQAVKRQVPLGMTSSGRCAHDGAVPPCPCSLGQAVKRQSSPKVRPEPQLDVIAGVHHSSQEVRWVQAEASLLRSENKTLTLEQQAGEGVYQALQHTNVELRSQLVELEDQMLELASAIEALQAQVPGAACVTDKHAMDEAGTGFNAPLGDHWSVLGLPAERPPAGRHDNWHGELQAELGTCPAETWPGGNDHAHRPQHCVADNANSAAHEGSTCWKPASPPEGCNSGVPSSLYGESGSQLCREPRGEEEVETLDSTGGSKDLAKFACAKLLG